MKCNILSIHLLFIIAMIYSWITCVVQCPEGASLPSHVKRRCEILMAKKRESDRDIMCVIILVSHVHSSCLITLLGPLSIPYSCSFRLYICPLMVPYNCTKFLLRDNGTNEQEAIERWLKWPPEDHHSSLASLLQAKIQSILIKQNTNTLALDVKILYIIQILRKVAHLNVLMRNFYI